MESMQTLTGPQNIHSWPWKSVFGSAPCKETTSDTLSCSALHLCVPCQSLLDPFVLHAFSELCACFLQLLRASESCVVACSNPNQLGISKSCGVCYKCLAGKEDEKGWNQAGGVRCI
eukprot:scaffold120976_cov19-Tisochrysis_lutea.AAC.2